MAYHFDPENDDVADNPRSLDPKPATILWPLVVIILGICLVAWGLLA